MKNYLCLFFCLFTFNTFADVMPDSVAPDFKLQDIGGSEVSLSKFKGKWVVLEWFNKDCPFVRKHYDTKNMQNLQKKYTDKSVIWLSIISSAKGKQGYEENADAIKTKAKEGAHSTYTLVDSKGVVGKLYGAKTTPHMFVISPEQKVIYAGAIDDNSSTDHAVIATSKNYVANALDLAMAKKNVDVKATKPYGCNVKY